MPGSREFLLVVVYILCVVGSVDKVVKVKWLKIFEDVKKYDVIKIGENIFIAVEGVGVDTI